MGFAIGTSLVYSEKPTHFKQSVENTHYPFVHRHEPKLRKVKSKTDLQVLDFKWKMATLKIRKLVTVNFHREKFTKAHGIPGKW